MGKGKAGAQGRQPANPKQNFGEMSEWSKEHAWKVCMSKGIEGSNPSLTANSKPRLSNISIADSPAIPPHHKTPSQQGGILSLPV